MVAFCHASESVLPSKTETTSGTRLNFRTNVVAGSDRLIFIVSQKICRTKIP
jgi:hypothetical protein